MFRIASVAPLMLTVSLVIAADDDQPTAGAPESSVNTPEPAGSESATPNTTKPDDSSAKPPKKEDATNDSDAKKENGTTKKAADKSEDPTTGLASKYPVDEDEWLSADPLLIIDSEMNFVVSDMKEGDLFRPHSTTQPRIIARFDRLIEMLERKKSGSGAAGGQPSMPAADSTLAGGPDAAGELRAADDETGAMEKIPPNQRKKIQQANADGFPPGFDDVLSDYYRRLAETKAVE